MAIQRLVRKIFQLPWLAAWIGPVLLYLPVLMRGQVVYWGTPFLQFVPWRAAAWESLRQGVLPLWNPWVGMGAPLLANYQSALLYPPTWFLLALQAVGGTPWQAWGQTLVIIAHLAWGGFGMAVLARQMGMDEMGQAVAALAFSMCGYLVARASFLSINAAAAWLPWMMWAVVRIARQAELPEGLRWPRGWKDSAILAMLAGMQLLAGHAQTVYITWLLLASWAIYWSLTLRGAGRRLAVLAHITAALAAGAALAAVQLLPTAEYLAQSQRAASVDYSFAMNYSFLPWRFLTLLAPNLFGTPAQGTYLLHADNYWEDAVYIGLLPLFLAIGAVFKRNAHPVSQPVNLLARLRWFLLGAILLSFLLALGENTPLFPFLYRYVPTFNMFQGPARFTLAAEWGLCLLAGFGASGWKRPVGRARGWVKRGIASAAAIVLGALAALFVLSGVAAVFVQAVILTGILGILAGFFSLFNPRVESQPLSRGGKVWQWGILLLIATDLFLTGTGLNPGGGWSLYAPANPDAVRSPGATARTFFPALVEETVKFHQFFKFNDFTRPMDWDSMRAVGLPNANILNRTATANNFDPMLPGNYAAWMTYLNNLEPVGQANWLRLMGVGAVASLPAPGAPVQWNALEGGARWRWQGCAVWVAERTQAWERLVTRVEAGQTNPVILTGTGTATECSAGNQAQITLTAENSQRVTLRVSSPSAGWVILADNLYPGWQGLLDGKPVPVLAADTLFRAIAVPDGAHTVEFVYVPIVFYGGAAVSLLAVVFLVVFFAYLARIR